jgi:hypothetical protein
MNKKINTLLEGLRELMDSSSKADLVEYEEPVGTYAKGDLTVEWPGDVDSKMKPLIKAIESKSGGLITVNLGSYGSNVEAIFRLNGSAIEKMLGGRKIRRVK